jgi:hypothetical protein
MVEYDAIRTVLETASNYILSKCNGEEEFILLSLYWEEDKNTYIISFISVYASPEFFTVWVEYEPKIQAWRVTHQSFEAPNIEFT